MGVGNRKKYKDLHLGIGVLNRSMVETVVCWHNYLVSKELQHIIFVSFYVGPTSNLNHHIQLVDCLKFEI